MIDFIELDLGHCDRSEASCSQQAYLKHKSNTFVAESKAKEISSQGSKIEKGELQVWKANHPHSGYKSFKHWIGLLDNMIMKAIDMLIALEQRFLQHGKGIIHKSKGRFGVFL